MELKKNDLGAGSYELEPLVQYSLPSGEQVNIIEGKISRNGDRKVQIDLRSNGPCAALRATMKGELKSCQNVRGEMFFASESNQLIQIGLCTQNFNFFRFIGALEYVKSENSLQILISNLKMTSEILGQAELNGKVTRAGYLVYAEGMTKYGENLEHTLEEKYRIGQDEDGTNILKFSIQSSQFPKFSTELASTMKREQNGLDFYMEGAVGPKGNRIAKYYQKSNIQFDSIKSFDMKKEVKSE